jgi:transcriptional regulator with GAF, ATPase, and Fis domain
MACYSGNSSSRGISRKKWERPDAKLAIITQDVEMERLLLEAHEIADSQASVFATTNRDIEKQIRDERFGEDLFYRLNIIPFHLPS